MEQKKNDLTEPEEIIVDSDQLIQSFEGFYIDGNHATMIWQGNKTLIIKPEIFIDSIGKLFYLIGGNDVYGIIKIRNIELIDLVEFNKRSSEHMITESERLKWWFSKKKLFAYEFDIVKLFEFPTLVGIPDGTKTIITDVQFLSELVKRGNELVRKLGEYDPTDLEVEQLREDLRVVFGLYNSKKTGKKLEQSFEKIENTLEIILKELINRKNTVFHPEKMELDTRKLFEKIMNKIKLDGEERGFFNNFNDTIVLKDVISVLGSSVKGNKYNDVDIVVKLNDPSDFLKKSIETRLIKMFPEGLADKINFIWNASELLNNPNIPVYDLILKKRDVFKVVNEKDSKIVLFNLVESMKPKRRFHKISEVVDYMFG